MGQASLGSCGPTMLYMVGQRSQAHLAHPTHYRYPLLLQLIDGLAQFIELAAHLVETLA